MPESMYFDINLAVHFLINHLSETEIQLPVESKMDPKRGKGKVRVMEQNVNSYTPTKFTPKILIVITQIAIQ